MRQVRDRLPFAQLEVVPEIEEEDLSVEIDPEDLRNRYYRRRRRSARK